MPNVKAIHRLLLLLSVVTGLSLISGCSSPALVETDDIEREKTEMATLHIHLQEGFFEDSVIVKVNDQRIFAEDGISENLMKALSDDSLQAEVPLGEVTVEIQVETRDLTAEESFNLTVDPMYLGIAIIDNNIQFRGPMEETFFYG